MVATEARFAAVDQVIQSFMDQTQTPVRAELRTQTPVRAELRWACARVRLMITCDLAELEGSTGQGSSDRESAEVLEALLEDAGHYRVVLTEGRFVDARGFEIEDGGAVAILLEQSAEEIEEIEELDENGDVVVYSLTWTTADER